VPGVRGASHAHVGHAGQTACLTSRFQLGDECGDFARHLAGHFWGRQMARVLEDGHCGVRDQGQQVLS
jgi:hypothetical protein